MANDIIDNVNLNVKWVRSEFRIENLVEHFSEYGYKFKDKCSDDVFNFVIWKLIKNIPLRAECIILKKRATCKSQYKIIGGLNDIRCIYDFMNGRNATVLGVDVEWENLSDIEKDILLSRQIDVLMFDGDETDIRRVIDIL